MAAPNDPGEIRRVTIFFADLVDSTVLSTRVEPERVSSLATPGAVVVSDAVEMLIHNDFELEACAAALVKGVEKPVVHYRIVAGSR